MVLLKTGGVVHRLGAQTLRFPRYGWNLLLFILHGLRPVHGGRSTLNRATLHSLNRQLIFTGVDALPVLALLSLALGVGVVVPMIATLELFVQREDLVQWVSQLVLLELSCLLAAIIIVGRSGTAISVDLGSMKLNRELEGLELLGINITQVLLAPRLLACSIAQLVLSIYVGVIAIVTGCLVLAWYSHAGYLQYIVDIARQLHPHAIIGFVLKNLLYGLLIAAIACWHGLQVSHSRNELPQQAARAVVNALGTIIVLNAVITIWVWWW